MILSISNSIFPLGTRITALSPFFLPKRPFPIGELTEIFPFAKSASLSATKVYFIVELFDKFLTSTVDKTKTFEWSILDSLMILAFDNVSSSLDILNSKRP